MIRPQGEITPGTTQSDHVDAEWPYVNPEIVAKLMQLATQLFGGKASIAKDRDPEYPDDKYYVLRIGTNLSPEEIVKAEKQWIRGLCEMAPGLFSVRLLILAH